MAMARDTNSRVLVLTVVLLSLVRTSEEIVEASEYIVFLLPNFFCTVSQFSVAI